MAEWIHSYNITTAPALANNNEDEAQTRFISFPQRADGYLHVHILIFQFISALKNKNLCALTGAVCVRKDVDLDDILPKEMPPRRRNCGDGVGKKHKSSV